MNKGKILGIIGILFIFSSIILTLTRLFHASSRASTISVILFSIIAAIITSFLSSWIIPTIIQKYKIKDDIKHIKTLPIGTAPFKVFLKLVKWVLLGWFFVSFIFLMVAFVLQLFGINLFD